MDQTEKSDVGECNYATTLIWPMAAMAELRGDECTSSRYGKSVPWEKSICGNCKNRPAKQNTDYGDMGRPQGNIQNPVPSRTLRWFLGNRFVAANHALPFA